MEVPARREEVGQPGIAHEGRQQAAAAADRFGGGAEHDHRVRRVKATQRTEGELHLARAPLVLHRPRRQADVEEAVAQCADRPLDAVEPRLGQELVALLEHVDDWRHGRHARLVEGNAIVDEADDVELHFQTGHVRIARLFEPTQLLAKDGAAVERHGATVAEVDVANQPAGAVRPGQHTERLRVRDDEQVWEAGELVDPEAAAGREGGREHPVGGVEAVDGSGEVGAVAHRGDGRLGGEELRTGHPMLVDEHDTNGAKPLLANLRSHFPGRRELFLAVQSVLLHEAGTTDSVVRGLALARPGHVVPPCLARPSTAARMESMSCVAKHFGCISARVSSVSVRCRPGICHTLSSSNSRRWL